MKTLLLVSTAAALLAVPVLAFAHTFRAPETVTALADGSFEYRWTVTLTGPVTLSMAGCTGVLNVNEASHMDGFCVPLAAGDSITFQVSSVLQDHGQDGAVRNWVEFCDFTRVETTTRILPIPTTHTDERASGPGRFWNHPNPVVSQTTFHYTLARSGSVTLRVFDANGRLLTTPLNEVRSAGTHAFTWSIGGARGIAPAPGVYIARLEGDGVVRTRRLVVTR